MKVKSKNMNERAMINSVLTGTDSIVEKWTPAITRYEKASDNQFDYLTKATTAILLENTNRAYNSYGKSIMNEATQPSAVSFQKRYAINMLAAVN